MITGTKLKNTFEVESKYSAFYTGGEVFWTNDGKEILCQNYNSIKILDIETGTVTETISDLTEEDDEAETTINTFTLSPNNESIVIAYKNGILKLWSKQDLRATKSWRSLHKGPIAKLAIYESILASGGSDGDVRICNLEQQTCTANLKGCEGVISVLKFQDEKKVFAAADDTKIRGWNLNSGELVAQLSGHYSKVSDMDFHPDGEHMVSCSRDKIVILWNLKTQSSVKVLPLFESLGAIRFLPEKVVLPNKKLVKGLHVACAGESGVVKIWNVSTGKEVYSQMNSLIGKAKEEGSLAVVHMSFNSNQILLVSNDHNLLIHDLESFDCVKQFIGFSDEVLDICFVGEDETHIAVATNSLDIKFYELSTMNCQLLKGHTDLVLSLSGSKSHPDLLLSSSKDNTIRLWSFDGSTMNLVSTGSRHTSSVLTVSLNNLPDSKFAVSASEDTTIKVWDLTNETLTVTHTEVAHPKDINCVTISPNDKLIASCSKDKTIKLWSSDLQHLGTLKGHKRGVWTVRFSPIDQVLMSTSADCSIKIWSVTEFNCLKTFEGHDSSVLRAEFITTGLQIVSTGSDGLIKLWNLKTSECMQTLDEHSGRIWALTIPKQETFILTGGSDSQLTKFKDVTIEKREEQIEKQTEMIQEEQKMNNLLQSNQLTKALRIALKLDRPYQALKIIQKIVKFQKTSELDLTIGKLSQEHKELLLNMAVSWNSNSKFCHNAQLVLKVLFNEILAGEFRPNGLRNTLEALLPYTERHMKRLTKHLEDLYYLNYLVDEMEAFNTN